MEVAYVYGIMYKQPWLPTPVRIHKKVRTYRAALEAVDKVLGGEYPPTFVSIVRLKDDVIVSIHAKKEETSG